MLGGATIIKKVHHGVHLACYNNLFQQSNALHTLDNRRAAFSVAFVQLCLCGVCSFVSDKIENMCLVWCDGWMCRVLLSMLVNWCHMCQRVLKGFGYAFCYEIWYAMGSGIQWQYSMTAWWSSTAATPHHLRNGWITTKFMAFLESKCGHGVVIKNFFDSISVL